MTQNDTARACGTIVLTDALAGIHRADNLTAWVKHKTGSERYNLISLPSLERFQWDVVDILVQDIATAVSPHRNERLLVYSVGDTGGLMDALRTELGRTKTSLEIEEYQVDQRQLHTMAHSETLVVSCMDWRLHGTTGRLIQELSKAMGENAEGFDLLATAGGGKELKHGYQRWHLVRDKIRESGAKRVVVLSHTDCGRYGGNVNFVSLPHELAALSSDLNDALNVLIMSDTCMDIRVGIVQVEKDCVERVILF